MTGTRTPNARYAQRQSILGEGYMKFPVERGWMPINHKLMEVYSLT